MKKYCLAALSILLSSLCVFASGAEESSSSAAPSGEPLTFMMPSTTVDMLGGPSALDEIIAEYRARGGGEVEIVSVEFSEYKNMLEVRIAAGAEPDLFVLQPQDTAWLRDIGVLTDLSFLVKQADFYTEPVRDDGRVYGLPFVMNAGGLFYNRSVFNEHGLPFPEGGEFDGFSQYFRSSGTSFLAAGGKDFPLEAYVLFDLCLAAEVLRYNPRYPEDLAAGRAGFHDEVFLRAAERAAGLFGAFPSSYSVMSGADAVDMFLSRDAAVIPAGTWRSELFTDWNEDRVFTGLPSSPGGHVLRAYTTNLAVSGYSDNRDAAADFAAFLLKPEVQLRIASMGTAVPVVRGVGYPEGPKRGTIEALDKAVYVSGIGFFDMMIDAGIDFDDIKTFYKVLYRAGAEGGSPLPAVDRLSDVYYRVTGLGEPAPAAAPDMLPVPSRPEPSGSGGSNAPNAP